MSHKDKVDSQRSPPETGEPFCVPSHATIHVPRDLLKSTTIPDEILHMAHPSVVVHRPSFLNFGHYSIQGRRTHMEDVIRVDGRFLGSPTMDLFSIFDGHGTDRVAVLCAHMVGPRLAEQLRDQAHAAGLLSETADHHHHPHHHLTVGVFGRLSPSYRRHPSPHGKSAHRGGHFTVSMVPHSGPPPPPSPLILFSLQTLAATFTPLPIRCSRITSEPSRVTLYTPQQFLVLFPFVPLHKLVHLAPGVLLLSTGAGGLVVTFA